MLDRRLWKSCRNQVRMSRRQQSRNVACGGDGHNESARSGVSWSGLRSPIGNPCQRYRVDRPARRSSRSSFSRHKFVFSQRPALRRPDAAPTVAVRELCRRRSMTGGQDRVAERRFGQAALLTSPGRKLGHQWRRRFGRQSRQHASILKEVMNSLTVSTASLLTSPRKRGRCPASIRITCPGTTCGG